jgi:hypothetical protein
MKNIRYYQLFCLLNYISEMSNVVKFLFELVTHRQVFDFPKLSMYGVFSQII